MFNRRALQPGWSARSALVIGVVCIPPGGAQLTAAWPGTEQALSSPVLCGSGLDMQDEFKELAGLTPKTWRGAAGGQEQAWMPTRQMR